MVCGAMLSWGPVTSGVLQGKILGSIWFNILINDVEGGTRHSDDIEQGQMADTLCVSQRAGETGKQECDEVREKEV